MTDYISRESVLQILSGKNAAWDAYQKVQSLPAADAIEELSRENESLAKSVNEASEILRKRWIPVTERLPEEKTYVLILFDTIAGKMQGVCFLYKDDDGHNCWTWLDRLGKNLFDIQPTHWMPLPKPPKEE